MSNKLQTIGASKLLENKAKILLRELNQNLSDLRLQEKEEILMKYNNVIKRLYSTLATPLLSVPGFSEGKPLKVEEINSILKSTDQDLKIVYEEFANLRTSMAENFNSLSIQAQRVRTAIAKVVSDLIDYRAQNYNNGFFTYSDSFNNMEKVESDPSKYKDSKAYIDNEWGKVCLPLVESDPQPIGIKSLSINANSNGQPGNNQEIGALKRDNPAFMNDKNLDTWYEYERVSRSPFNEPLIFEYQIELKQEQIINLLELSLVGFPNGSAPAITEIETSNDGVLYVDFFKNYIGSTEIDSRGDEVIPLGSASLNPLEKNKLLFFPKKAKFIRIRMIQDSSFLIRTPSGIKNRLAIGVKEIAIKAMKFRNKGQFISTSFAPSREIGKVYLKVDDYLPEGFPVTNKYSISTDDGQKWHPINPVKKVNLEVPEVLNFNLDFIPDSIKTETPVTSLKLKADLEIEEPKGDAVSNSIKTEVPISQFTSMGKGTKRISLEQVPLGGVEVYNVGFGSVGRGSFYRIPETYIRDRDNEYVAYLPLEVFSANSIEKDTEVVYCEDALWKRVEDLTQHGADERVYEFDYINNAIRFAYSDGTNQYGKKPSERLLFKLKREAAVLENSGDIKVKTRFLHDGVKESISVYQVREENKVEVKRLKPRSQVHSLGIDEIESIAVLSDDANYLAREVEYVNGYSELYDAGDYSINYQSGTIYTFDLIGDTDIVEIEVTHKVREPKRFEIIDGDIVLNKEDYSINKKDKVISVSTPTFVVDLGEKNIEKGSVVFNIFRDELSTELAFSGDGREFDDIDDIEGPYSIDYRNGLLYVPEKISGEISLRFNTTSFFVEYNIASKIPQTEITVKKEEKYLELSDSYVIKFFADSNLSSTDGLFKLEYKYAEEVKEPPRELLDYVSPFINRYEILTVFKEDI